MHNVENWSDMDERVLKPNMQKMGAQNQSARPIETLIETQLETLLLALY